MYVDFWSLKTSSVCVFHFVIMSFKRRGHFAKETWQNFVVKWLCSLDLLDCHDARWNALINLCWLMCACVSVCENEYTNTRTQMWMFDRRFVSAVLLEFALIGYSGNCCEHENSLIHLLRRIIFKQFSWKTFINILFLFYI